MKELIIDDLSPRDILNRGMSGFVSRASEGLTVGYSAAIPPAKITPIPRSEWSDRIKEMEATKSRLSDIRDRGNNGGQMPSYNQNGQGYCWMYAAVIAVAILRAKANQPYVRLSAHGPACKVKNFRDEGGWGALGLEFLLKNGVPSVEAWPEQSMSRNYDTPATWADAAKYKPDEAFMDLGAPVYNRDLTFDQTMTCLLNRIPVVADFDHWGHAVCLVDPVEVAPGEFGVRLWNSWGDSWSSKGMGVLTGSKAVPSNAVAPATVLA